MHKNDTREFPRIHSYLSGMRMGIEDKGEQKQNQNHEVALHPPVILAAPEDWQKRNV